MRIIDYKSSSNYIRLNDIAYGIQLQLLTYLDAISKIEDLEPTAVLYFSLIEEKLDKRKSKEEIEKAIRDNFRMNGLVVSNIKLIKMMDKTLEYGSSSIIPAYITKERRNFRKRLKCCY